MKKTLILLVLTAVCCISRAQHSLTFNLSDVGNDSVTIELLDKAYFQNVESVTRVKANKGQFFYDLKGYVARLIRVYSKNGHMTAWAVPGEEGIVNGTMKKHVWTGTKFFTELASVEKAKVPLWEELNREVEKCNNKKITDKELIERFEVIISKIDAINADYVKRHPDSGLSVVLCQESNDGMELLNLIKPETIVGPFSCLAGSIAAADFLHKNKIKASLK